MNREFRIVGETERTQYLYRLRKALGRTDWRLVSYAVMSNHLHLALLAGNATAARLIQSANGSYAIWLNKTQGRLGPVFAERYAAIMSDESKAARLIAYLHNNPVRAGVVGEAGESSWTSQLAYLEGGANEWLDVELGLSLSGFDSSPAGRQGFYDYVCGAAGITREQMAEDGLTSIRRAVRHQAGAPVEISDLEVGPTGQGVQVVAPHFMPIRPRWPGDVEAALLGVEVVTGVSVERMRSRDRHRRVVAARRLAVHLWKDHLGRDGSTMSCALGISASAASQLTAHVDAETIRLAKSIARSLWDLESTTYASET